MTKLLISPHNDDAVLFASFTALRFRPTVLTVFDSFVQVDRGFAECSKQQRNWEDGRAMERLGCTHDSLHVPDNLSPAETEPAVHAALLPWKRYASEVWIPAVEEGGHEQHNVVGEVAAGIFCGVPVHRYLTYTRTRGKSTTGKRVECTGAMVRTKLMALACYQTQLEIDALGCWPHFMDLWEYELR